MIAGRRQRARRGPRVLVRAVLAAVLLPAAALAQSARFGGASDQPIEVYAQQGIEWRQNEQSYIARGDAVAIQGDFSVYGEILTAHYRKDETGKTDIYRIDAEQDVRVTSESGTAYGDKGVYDVSQGVAVLTGDDLRLETPEHTVTARDSLEYWDQRQMAVARGNAVAHTEDKTLKGDVLSALLRETDAGQMEIHRVEAFGDVVITTPTEVARGERGVYDVETGIATLMGSVKITRGEDQLNGEYGEVNMETGVSRLLAGPPSAEDGGRVRALITPKPEKTGDEAKPKREPAEQ